MLYLLNNVVYTYSLSRSLWDTIDRFSVHISWYISPSSSPVMVIWLSSLFNSKSSRLRIFLIVDLAERISKKFSPLSDGP